MALPQAGMKLHGIKRSSLSIGWTIAQAGTRRSAVSEQAITKQKESVRCCEDYFNQSPGPS